MSGERYEIKEKISKILNELYTVYFDLEKNSVNNDNLSTENLNTLFIDGTFIDGANRMYNIMKKIISTNDDGYTVKDLFNMFNCATPEEIFDEFSAEAILVTADRYFGYKKKEVDIPKEDKPKENTNKVKIAINLSPGNIVRHVYIDNVSVYDFDGSTTGLDNTEVLLVNQMIDPGDEIAIKLSKPMYGLMLYHNEAGEKTLEQIDWRMNPVSTDYYTFKVPNDAFGIAHINLRSGYSILTPDQKKRIEKDSVIFDFINSSGWFNRDSIHITTK